jgi:hypothetical protein
MASEGKGTGIETETERSKLKLRRYMQWMPDGPLDQWIDTDSSELVRSKLEC